MIKRDDQTGLATGGNKARKLEFLMADAQAKGADVVLTVGGAQSNHARQTAAAAARCGVRCILVLRKSGPSGWNGNLLLDDLLGAEVRWCGDRPREEVMAEVVEEERAVGHNPYPIPLGGSNAVGATGYVAAMEELMRQLAEREVKINHILFASSSGGTQAGLIVGARALGFEGRVMGISVDYSATQLCTTLQELVPQTAAHLGLNLGFSVDDYLVNDSYTGGGYGVVGEAEREAIRLMARSEGILLDPVYTGRALAGLIDLVRRGLFSRDETVLFWHTGGTPALFAYAQELL